MLDVVCSYQSRGNSQNTVATIFDPPSNVRSSPNGSVLCSIRERRAINIYGSKGSWYYIDACGEIGVIHSSQVRF